MSSAPKPQDVSMTPAVPRVVPLGGDYCDFCCAPPVFKVYRCANFSVKGKAVFASGTAVGSWAACRKCAELVDQAKWIRLTDRAVRKFVKRHCVVRQEVAFVRVQLAEVSRLFAEHLLVE
jgi:hypothetical protein